jgi:two-component system response regulator VicR
MASEPLEPAASGTRGSILIVEDSPPSAQLLVAMVKEEGFNGEVCGTASEAMERFQANRPVAVLLDWVLPDRSGVELCRELRAQNPTLPIIFVSARDDEASASRALDAGADDYMVKPIRRIELMARLEAHLRKAAAMGQPLAAPAESPVKAPAGPAAGGGRSVRFGKVQVDIAARTVTVDGAAINMGHLEFDLLAHLCENPGVAISRERLLRSLYGKDAKGSSQRVDLLVRRIRAKLGSGPGHAEHLIAVPGFGYRLERRTNPR